jgi:hypothetical protein
VNKPFVHNIKTNLNFLNKIQKWYKSNILIKIIKLLINILKICFNLFKIFMLLSTWFPFIDFFNLHLFNLLPDFSKSNSNSNSNSNFNSNSNSTSNSTSNSNSLNLNNREISEIGKKNIVSQSSIVKTSIFTSICNSSKELINNFCT